MAFDVLPDAGGTVRRVRILYRDDLVLAIDKPAGLTTVPGRTSNGDPPLSALVREVSRDALPVHRLDRDTSGVVLFALGPAAHRALSISFESRRAEKTYLALCRGALLAATRCELPLAEARRGGMRIATEGDLSQPARTDFAPLEHFETHGGLTWLEARPRTGRTHQIRVHLAALEHALAVDPRYGDAAPIALGEGVVLSRLPLHAAALRVPHPSGRGWLSIEAPLPEDLSRCLERLRAQRRA
ncbi:MAG: hypothetical protein NVS2B9_20280 [Myxococcales bacterium]